MPRLLIGQVQYVGHCSTCGVAAGEFCRSENGIELRSYAHSDRTGLPRLNIDRSRNGELLPKYPLAKRYEWECEGRVTPMIYQRTTGDHDGSEEGKYGDEGHHQGTTPRGAGTRWLLGHDRGS